MTEAQDQGQDTGSEATQQSQRAEPTSETQRSQEPQIPKFRFDEVNKAKRQAESELKKLKDEQQRREEERAQSQGEYQQLAEKRQKKIESLTNEVQELKGQMVRDRRYRTWVSVASNHIKPGAIGDAFDMVTEEEWNSIDEEDENAVKMLAQNLSERKDYLSNSPIGSGSGGSKHSVFGLNSNNGEKSGTRGSRPTMQFKKPRPLWK